VRNPINSFLDINTINYPLYQIEFIIFHTKFLKLHHEINLLAGFLQNVLSSVNNRNEMPLTCSCRHIRSN